MVETTVPCLIITDDRCLAHAMQPGHPERPERLCAVIRRLEHEGLKTEATSRSARPATDAELARIHPPSHIESLVTHAPVAGLAAIDVDTAMNPATLEAARLAAGAVVDGVVEVFEGTFRRVFCATRPPGHHAEASKAMGFCFFNNVAAGAAAAIAGGHAARVAIVDFDVHHGNGTVDIFMNCPEVLVCSTFQHPFYPHRHYDVQRPNIVTSPLAAGAGSRAFRAAVERDWLPALDRHRPELVLVSAGFDAHRDDPLGNLDLDEGDFDWVTRRIVTAAEQHAGGRIVSTLEGGYELAALARSVATHVAALG